MITRPVLNSKIKYFSKKKWNWVTDNKFRLKRRFFFFFKNTDISINNLKTTVMPKEVLAKREFIFWLVLNYKLYTLVTPYVSRTVISFKFLRRVNALFVKNPKNLSKLKTYNLGAPLFGFIIISNFLSFYNIFFRNTYSTIFHFFKKFKNNKPLYRLTITFRRNKLFINLQDFLKENLITLSPGLLVEHFEKRKAMKKSKTLKFLIIKYLRKLMFLGRIRNLMLIVKKTPALLLEFINLFNQSISHKFNNPFSNKAIEEKSTDFTVFKFTHFVFLRTASFVKNKTRKKGRVKRKVLQKVIFENHVID